MQLKSHILIKYLVIPIIFISLLVVLDFFSTDKKNKETISEIQCWMDFKVISCNLAYTDTHTFSYIPGSQTLVPNQSLTLYITPISGKVKGFSIINENEKIHFCCIAILGHILLPVIMMITGFFSIRSESKFWIFIIILELVLLISYLTIL